jgi:proton-dependent oligopeptide transporter, POT family
MKNLFQSVGQFPKQTKYIIGNEACERFSYYGMRSILVVFMIQHLQMAAEEAKAAYHLFASAVYLLPLVGGWLSDRYFGKYRTIFWLSLIYCLGHLALSAAENRWAFFLGLGLIAVGSGGIKPCVSAFVGDQFNQKNQHLLGRVFDLFYWSINFGSFFATLLIPVLLVKYGPSVAFAIPGVLMGLATLIFWMGRKDYVQIVPSQEKRQANFSQMFLYSCLRWFRRKPTQRFWDIALERFSKEEVEGAQAVSSIVKVFVTVSVFWALFDQNASSWVLQAQSMKAEFLGVHIEPAQIQALNPVLVMILIPIFGSVIYPTLQRIGIHLTPLRKMSVGMVLAGLSFVMVGVLQAFIDSGHTLSIAWQFFPFLVLTCAEVMISITGLEFAYTQAPASMKSTIMSFWLLTVFAGNLLDAVIAQLNIFQGAMSFYFFAALMFVVSLIFVLSASRYQRKKQSSSGNSPLMGMA